MNKPRLAENLMPILQLKFPQETKIFYQLKGRGQLLVFIHGFSLDYRMWEYQIHKFSPEYQVLSYDLRGFGKSSLPVSGQNYSHAEDLHNLLQILAKDTKIILIGFSLGGRVAIDYLLKFPVSVAGIVIADSVPEGFPRQIVRVSTSDSLKRIAQEDGIEAAKALWLHSEIFAQTKNNPSLYEKLSSIVNAYSGWHWINDDPANFLDAYTILNQRKLEKPFLSIVGERDLSDYRQASQSLAQFFVGAETVVIPGAGHMSSMESPEIFNQAIDKFIKGIGD